MYKGHKTAGLRKLTNLSLATANSKSEGTVLLRSPRFGLMTASPAFSNILPVSIVVEAVCKPPDDQHRSVTIAENRCFSGRVAFQDATS